MASTQKENVSELIKLQGDLVRKLKAEKAPKEKVGSLISRFFALTLSCRRPCFQTLQDKSRLSFICVTSKNLFY